jgi:uncharacterized membrane-anchored protein YhcB (DUF1043 family)
MDNSWTWTIGLIGFALGLVFGAGAGTLLRGNRKRVHELEEELAGLEQQFDDYRQQVTGHFRTTSELVQKMTDSYRDVYEHLASGSQALCQTKLGNPSLDFTQQPVLDTPAQQQAATTEHERKPADTETELRQEAGDDTCMGDAPCVPHLDIDEPQAATPRTP